MKRWNRGRTPETFWSGQVASMAVLGGLAIGLTGLAYWWFGGRAGIAARLPARLRPYQPPRDFPVYESSPDLP